MNTPARSPGPKATAVFAARLVVVCALAAAVALGRGADLFGSQNAQPTFRSEVRVIDVDVFVTDKDGRFVRNLTQDDFEVLEDGKPQKIVTFSFTDLPIEEPVPAAPGPNAPEPDIATNRSTAPDRRVFVILMDSPSTEGPGGLRTSITYDEFARRFARQFVEESASPGDSVAVVHAQGTFSDSQAFTTSKSLMLASVDRYGRGLSGASAWEDLTGPEMVLRNLNTYRAIQDLSERLGAMSGRRKAILWVGGQLKFDPASAPCVPPDPRNFCAIPRSAGALLAAYRDAIGAATRNNVAIYPIDPSGMTTELGLKELERMAALRMVAEDTGGIAVVGTNNIAAQYQAIVRDTSTYYVLGYAPATAYRDSKFHTIQVRLKRPGLTVRARKGYFAPAPDSRAPAPPPLPEGVSVAARDALRMPVPLRGLTIDLFNAPFKGSGRDGSVVIGGQISGDLRLGADDTITLSYQIFTLEGQLRTGEYKVFTLNLKPETRARVEETGLRFVDRIGLPPGRYELRFVADQPGGSVGSIVTHLDVPAFDDTLALSGLTLAALSVADHPTLRGDAGLRESLGAEPTAVRRFSQGDLLNLFAEVYSSDSGTRADDITVAAIVTTTAGNEVKRESGELAPESGMGGRWGVAIELSLTDVEPGHYVLNVEAARTGRADRPVQRRIPFVVE